MSWPQWQPPAQPTMPVMNPAMPMGIQYTAEQWQQVQQQNWQQWAQWQQQYQQWHQQYGAEYQKSLTAMANMGATISPATPIANTTALPPLPIDTKPPPPPDEPTQPLNTQNAQQVASQLQNSNLTKNTFPSNTKSAYGYNTTADSTTLAGSTWNASGNHRQNDYQQHQGKRQALEHHADVALSKKNKFDWQAPTSSAAARQPFGPQLPAEENKEDLSDPEKKFAKQFAEWEAQFNKWKEQNQDHPDKAQYREYEKKWEAWRNQLLERRELMRQKRLGMIPASANANTSLEIRSNISASAAGTNAISRSSADRNAIIAETGNPSNINPINSKALATLFKSNSNAGIPGLDLVDAPAQPDEVPQDDQTLIATVAATSASAESTPGLNLEALSKNLNSILGDQKLLSMLSLVAQGAGVVPVSTDVQPPQPSQTPAPVQTIPSGITLAPAKTTTLFDDQASNWSTNTNTSGNSTSWSQDFSNQNHRSENVLGRDFNPVITSTKDGRHSNPQKSHREPRPTRFSGGNDENVKFPMQEDYSTNSRAGNQKISYSAPADFFERDSADRFGEFDSDGRFTQQNNNYEESYWSPPDAQNEASNMAPAPPTITNFDEILHIDKIVDYEHKIKKQDTTDVRVFTPRLFDYRHKLVTRIPLPERPKWLLDSFHNIPEFEPPISRSIPMFARHPADRYPAGGPPGGPPGGGHSNFSTFSRRPGPAPMGDKLGGAAIEFDKSGDDYRRRNNNRDDFDMYKRQNFGGRDLRDSRDAWDSRDARNDDWDRGRDRDRDRFRDRDRDRSKDLSRVRDARNSPGGTSSNGKRDTLPGSDRFNSTGMSSFAQNQQLFSSALKIKENRVSHATRTSTDDLLHMPGRAKRPQRIVIILRGPPGSGKTFLAKQIKDKETENGGSAPRILALDDYFMVEQEKDVIEDGKTVKVKETVYEYEECMEASYRQSLLKTFKKTITDGYFSFIIVDNVNDKVKYFDDMWSFAKQNGFQVYICQLDLDVQICTKRNVHGRSEVEIQHIVNGWEEVPSHYGILDATNLIQAGAIAEVEMEEINSPNDDFDEEDNEEQACNSSKWDSFECSVDNLAKLDGINKPLRSAGTMEDYLQLDEWTVNRTASRPGQKRVRWADLEEHKEQEKMRAIGFVVGQTDWGRMMDPTLGGSALTQTKYIERVGIRKVNTN